jgi:probable rRNA maturation factor
VNDSKQRKRGKAPIGNSSPARVSVRNLQRTIRVNVVALQKFAAKALRACLKLNRGQAAGLATLREISVVLVSDRRMSQLHRQFLHQRGPTDVLTFEHGEIFLSVPMAERNARRFGNSLVREMRLYIIHGLLHLHGFDDRTGRSAREMEKMQAKILARLR